MLETCISENKVTAIEGAMGDYGIVLEASRQSKSLLSHNEIHVIEVEPCYRFSKDRPHHFRKGSLAKDTSRNASLIMPEPFRAKDRSLRCWVILKIHGAC